MINIGLVVEGPHDIIMLEPIVAAKIREKFDEDVRFLQLQPTPDATGGYSGGGWSRVVAWCRTNAGAGLETFFTPLFAGTPSCDFIIIHMDGDALELSQYLSTLVAPSSPNPVQRTRHVIAMLEEWLQIEPSRRPKFAFAIPVLQTEAWILGAENSTLDIENIHAKKEFQSSYNFRRHGKLGNYYKRRTAIAVRDINRIAGKCLSYSLFEESVGSLTR